MLQAAGVGGQDYKKLTESNLKIISQKKIEFESCQQPARRINIELQLQMASSGNWISNSGNLKFRSGGNL